jgi:glycerol-3-phosphate dehydrogenase (NAD(P)+)
MPVRIAVVGAGSWGTALAQTLMQDGERTVSLWARRQQVADELAQSRRNPMYLPGFELDERVSVTADMATALDGASIVIFAVPTHAMRAIANAAVSDLERAAVAVSAAKGFEASTGLTMSAVLSQSLSRADGRGIAALSGPNIAVEVAAGLPAATVVAGPGDVAAHVRDACTGARLRFYSTTDCVGVEYGGALKNVVAIAAGASDGIGAGDNGKAAIITRGIAEMTRLGVAAGAQLATFAGLAGLGDCVVTCMSPHSRNRNLGEAIARGSTLEEALGRTTMVTEGVNATRVASRLADELSVDMPITREVHAVLFEGKSVRAGLADLMSRDPATETHGLARRDAIDSGERPGSSSGG